MRHLVRAVAVVALCWFAAGCGGGDRRASVSGKVTVAGKGPLTGGNIRFVSAADPNKTGGGQIKPDGSFEVSDAPVGACKVVIDNTHLDPSQSKAAAMPGVPMQGMKGMPGGPAVGGGGAKKEDKAKMGEAPKGADVPAEMGKAESSGQKFVRIEVGFSKPDTTALTFEVQPGTNTKDFEVK